MPPNSAKNVRLRLDASVRLRCRASPLAKFCDECATPVVADAQPRSADPRSYTPKHLAEKILTSRSRPRGRAEAGHGALRRREGLDGSRRAGRPRRVARILDRFFQILTDGVHRFEGTVNQYTGDGIMALFGAPIAHEDHAQRACHAALYLRDDAARFAAGAARASAASTSPCAWASIRARSSSAGSATICAWTTRAGPHRGPGAAHGAARRAGPDLPHRAHRAARRGLLRASTISALHVQGRSAPVRVFALDGLGPLRTRFDASRARGLSRFVGRDDEIRCRNPTLARFMRRGWGFPWVTTDMRTGGFPMENVAA